MKVDNLFNIYVSGWKEEDRLSSYFAFILYHNPNLLTKVLKDCLKLKNIGNTRKSQISPVIDHSNKLMIETQKTFPNILGEIPRVDIIIEIPKKYVLILENKIIRQRSKALIKQLKKYQKILDIEYNDIKRKYLFLICKNPLKDSE